MGTMKTVDIFVISLTGITVVALLHFSQSRDARIAFYNALNYLFGIINPTYRSLEYFLLSLTAYLVLAVFLLLTEGWAVTRTRRLLQTVFVVFTTVLSSLSLYVFIVISLYDVDKFDFSS